MSSIVVARAYGMAEAAVAISMLEAAGITVLPAHRHMMSVAWDYALALGGLEIRVPHSEADTAHAILAGFQPYRRQSFAAKIVFLLLYLLASVPPPAAGFSIVQLADRRPERVRTVA